MNMDTWRPSVFLILTVVLFGILSWLLLKKSGKGAIPALMGAVVCAFFSEASIFESFKFSAQNGLEAKIAEVNSATEELRKVAVAASTAVVGMTGLVSNGGMAMVQPARVRDQNKDRLISILKSMDVSSEQIQSVEEADHDGVVQQYLFSIITRLESKAQAQADRDKIKSYSEDIESETPEKLEKLLMSLSFHDKRIDELVKDFAYYVANGKQRRPEVWASRDDWFRD